MLARRRIQQLIDERLGFLSDGQVARFVHELNASGRRALTAEWELIILTSLSGMGVLEHEPELGGSTRLDVSFASTELGEFVADIRTISDDNYFRENPVEAFAEAFRKQLRKAGLSAREGGFFYRINGKSPPQPYPTGQKVTLRMPRVHRFSKEIFGTREFRQYLRAISDEPGSRHDLSIENSSVSLWMTYGPKLRGGHIATYPSFNKAHDLRHNVLRRALEAKANQIKRAGDGVLGKRKGVFVCDGGCYLFRAMTSIDSRSFDEIVRRFLRDSNTVDFVCAVDVIGHGGSFSERQLQFTSRCWSTDGAWAATIEQQLNRALDGIGRPENRPHNSLSHMQWAGSQRHLWGIYNRETKMTHNTVELSLRAIMDYLAGNVDRKGLEKIVHPDWLADVKARLDRGQSVEDVRVEAGSSGDDDTLVIVFGDYDAARAPFRKKVN